MYLLCCSIAFLSQVFITTVRLRANHASFTCTKECCSIVLATTALSAKLPRPLPRCSNCWPARREGHGAHRLRRNSCPNACRGSRRSPTPRRLSPATPPHPPLRGSIAPPCLDRTGLSRILFFPQIESAFLLIAISVSASANADSFLLSSFSRAAIRFCCAFFLPQAIERVCSEKCQFLCSESCRCDHQERTSWP